MAPTTAAAFSCALPHCAKLRAVAATVASGETPRVAATQSQPWPQFGAGRSGALSDALRDAPRWRLALLSDGHTTPLLSALATAPLTVRLQTVRGAQVPTLPSGERFDGEAAVLRVVTIHLPDGAPLFAAMATWSTRAYTALALGCDGRSSRVDAVAGVGGVSDVSDVFTARRVAASRAVLAVHFGCCARTAPLLHTQPRASTWARDVLFRRRRTTFLHVHEVLAPVAAARVLGPMPLPSSPLRLR
ncbi:unnamed protein product [Agarophyton chilense]